MTTSAPDRLERCLSLPGAARVGLGSMPGTGGFVSLAVAVQLAGDAVVLSLLLAAGAAVCNGLSSAQRAACHPVRGGPMRAYGHRCLHSSCGLAGCLFLALWMDAATALLGGGVPAVSAIWNGAAAGLRRRRAGP